MPGLPKKYAKMGFKKGWKAFKASKRRSPRRQATRTVRRRRSNPRPKSKARKMSKRGFLNTQTLFKFVRIGALVAPAAGTAMRTDLDTKGKLFNIISLYTGYHPGQNNFLAHRLAQGWLPYIMSVVATWGVSKLAGIIRRL